MFVRFCAQDSQITAEEKRLRDIEESKFLGGDVEHTHLVKGLDYALLQKLRSEREAAREAAEEEAEAELEVVAAKPKVDPEKSEKVTFRTKVVMQAATHPLVGLVTYVPLCRLDEVCTTFSLPQHHQSSTNFLHRAEWRECEQFPLAQQALGTNKFFLGILLTWKTRLVTVWTPQLQ